jgi:hypothetical protein
MLWLLWIAIMLLVPVFAGVQVWWQVNRPTADAPVPTVVVGTAEARTPDA